MLVKLLRDSFVKFQGGAVIEVSEEEGKRLIAFRNAEEEKPAPKKAAKKEAKK